MKRKGLERLLFGLSSAWIFVWARAVAWRRYDKKYLVGRWFTSPYGNLGAEGWLWVIQNNRACRRLGINLDVPWPVSPRIQIVNPRNITFDPNDMNNFQGFGNYYQAQAQITIGSGSYIAPNVGIITANHDPGNLNQHLPPKPVTLGSNCWIGMNSVILPGVTLGDGTVVGAGSVVTRSFPQGDCIIAGNPAKMLRDLKKEGI